jgi:hypothetical protein
MVDFGGWKWKGVRAVFRSGKGPVEWRGWKPGEGRPRGKETTRGCQTADTRGVSGYIVREKVIVIRVVGMLT